MLDGHAHTPAQLGDGGFQISSPKQARARHKCIHAGPGAVGTGLVVDAAVYADAVRQLLLSPPTGF